MGDIADWCNISFRGTPTGGSEIHSNLYIQGQLITDLTIPNGITSIGKYTFNGFDSLINLTIPESVTSIGNSAFENCTSLTSVTISGSVASIGAYAFSSCNNLTNVTIENGVTSIGEGVFKNCSNLKSAIIPDSVTSIGRSVFDSCSSLESLTLPFVGECKENNKYPFGYLFGWGSLWNGVGNETYQHTLVPDSYGNYYQYHQQTYYIPGSIESVTITGDKIPDYAFEQCDFSTIIFTDKLVSIGKYAFESCWLLTDVVIPKSVTSIGSAAFNNCHKLKDTYYEGTLEEWCNISFKGGGANPLHSGGNLYINNQLVTSVTIPDCITAIGYCFTGCTSLTEIILHNEISSIAGSAFEGCQNLTSIAIPNSVTSIGSRAFRDCHKLTGQIIIPNSVTSMGSSVFNLDNLLIYCEAKCQPEEWSSNWNNSDSPVVWDCNNNDVGEDGYIYTIIDGLLYGIKEGVSTVVRQSDYSIEIFTIPSAITYKGTQYSVTSIGSYAFYNYPCYPKKIIIPDSVTYIGVEAFDPSHSNLTLYFESIFLPEGWDYDSVHHFKVVYGYKGEN